MFQSCIHLRIQFQHYYKYHNDKGLDNWSCLVENNGYHLATRKGENYEECKQVGYHLESQNS